MDTQNAEGRRPAQDHAVSIKGRHSSGRDPKDRKGRQGHHVGPRSTIISDALDSCCTAGASAVEILKEIPGLIPVAQTDFNSVFTSKSVLENLRILTTIVIRIHGLRTKRFDAIGSFLRRLCEWQVHREECYIYVSKRLDLRYTFGIPGHVKPLTTEGDNVAIAAPFRVVKLPRSRT